MGVLTKMGLYRKLARSKKGMSTNFGGLFFIILLLMGFNLMLWGFIQMDAYNSVVNSMQQRDQQAISENLLPQNPGAVNITGTGLGAGNSFNILVNNLGGTSVSIASIYINNLSPTGSNNCYGATAPCVANPASSGTAYSFIGGNIQAGEINHYIAVNGISVGDGSGYKVVLSTTRGRLFSFYYPWPVSTPPPGGGNGLFVTNIGPLSIYFDFKSFNFTQGSQTVSNSAFCMPSTGSVVFWVKIANTATDSTVKLKAQTMMQMQPYSANGFGQFVRMWIDDPATRNPNNVVAYNEATNPYILPAATASGPGPSVIVYFSASSQGGSDALSMGRDDNWITFIGFYYIYRGKAQGQTIPFMDFRSLTNYPAGC